MLIMKRRFWGGRFQLDMRVIVGHFWHVGMFFSLFLMMVVYRLYYNTSWSGHGAKLSNFSAGYGVGSDQSLHANSEGRPLVQYKREWESSEVTETTANERFGEVAFGEVPTKFVPVGISSFLFVFVGAYRTGPNSFGVTGLGNQLLYQLSKPVFECSWVPSPSLTSESRNASEVTMGAGELIRGTAVNGTATRYTDDDVDYLGKHAYIAVVVYCTFDSPVGINREGGELRMVAKHDESFVYTGLRGAEFVALVEPPGVYNESVFDAPFRYDYLFCGPPLKGSISPHRAREWMAYHMRLFGESSHFIFYDVGGMDDVLWRVWEPWAKLGRVSIINARQQARYEASLANQVVLADDCLLRAKTLANWTFFFDIDEYLHVSHGDLLESTFHEVMSEMWQRGRRATSIEIEQRPMSFVHCVKNNSDPTLHQRQWAMEKLVYRRHVDKSEPFTHWKDYKSIHQAKYVLGRSIHYARSVEVPEGMEEGDTVTRLNCEGRETCGGDKLHYNHYHGTTVREPNEEVCKVFVDPSMTSIDYDGSTYDFDNTMSFLADSVREFESLMIGEMKI